LNQSRSESDMMLTPARPPGRSSRKALEYEKEIQRLRSLGYSFDAIRGALADAGIHVSKSTVRREAARSLLTVQTATRGTSPPASTASPRLLASDVDAPAPPKKPVPPPTSTPTSKDLAADFCSKHITNPLLRRTEP
jgi:hypothetical protein